MSLVKTKRLQAIAMSRANRRTSLSSARNSPLLTKVVYLAHPRVRISARFAVYSIRMKETNNAIILCRIDAGCRQGVYIVGFYGENVYHERGQKSASARVTAEG
jgi:hypothetical protein